LLPSRKVVSKDVVYERLSVELTMYTIRRLYNVCEGKRLLPTRKVVSKDVVYEWMSVELTMYTISRIDNGAKENHCYLFEM
jgi:hypothetical protein